MAVEALCFFNVRQSVHAVFCNTFFGMAGMIGPGGLKLETRMSNWNIWKRLLQHLTGLFVFTKLNLLIIGGESFSFSLCRTAW